MQTWQDILATAVVGTEQQQLSVTISDDQLGSLLAQVDQSDREGALLNVAALLAIYRRAGYSLEVDTQVVLEVSEVDEMRRSSSAATQHLSLMLEGEFNEVLPEWLAAIKDSGVRVAEEYLPALLDRGQAEQSLRESIIPVLGKRGRWLATQNPAWIFATPRNDQEIWDLGSRDERLWLLDRLRLSDPAAARELIAATWQQESARERAVFLEKLAANISSDDETFLNEALHDRSGDVRRAARKLLARLPGSEFAKRLTKLVVEVLVIKKPLLGKARIEVSLPDDPLNWLKQNEVEIDNPPRHVAQSLGPKGWTLKEMVALTPVSHWTERWQKSPAEIVSAAFESEWTTAFSEGFVAAVNRDRDPEWIEALISHRLNEAKPALTYASPVELAAHLPVPRLEALLMQLLKTASKGLNDTYPALQFLLVHQSPWSDQLSRAVINSIKTRIPRIQKGDTNDWQTRAALTQFARYISPALYEEVARDWPTESENWAGWSKAVDRFHSLLAFRRDMHLAITKKKE